MGKAAKTRITKCYLIEIVDKDDKEIESDFCFMRYRDAKEEAKKMLAMYKKENEDADSN